MARFSFVSACSLLRTKLAVCVFKELALLGFWVKRFGALLATVVRILPPHPSSFFPPLILSVLTGTWNGGSWLGCGDLPAMGAVFYLGAGWPQWKPLDIPGTHLPLKWDHYHWWSPNLTNRLYLLIQTTYNNSTYHRYQRFDTQTRWKGQFCFVLILLPCLCAFLNKGIFDGRLNSNNSYSIVSGYMYMYLEYNVPSFVSFSIVVHIILTMVTTTT